MGLQNLGGGACLRELCLGDAYLGRGCALPCPIQTRLRACQGGFSPDDRGPGGLKLGAGKVYLRRGGYRLFAECLEVAYLRVGLLHCETCDFEVAVLIWMLPDCKRFLGLANTQPGDFEVAVLIWMLPDRKRGLGLGDGAPGCIDIKRGWVGDAVALCLGDGHAQCGDRPVELGRDGNRSGDGLGLRQLCPRRVDLALGGPDIKRVHVLQPLELCPCLVQCFLGEAPFPRGRAVQCLFQRGAGHITCDPSLFSVCLCCAPRLLRLRVREVHLVRRHRWGSIVAKLGRNIEGGSCIGLGIARSTICGVGCLVGEACLVDVLPARGAVTQLFEAGLCLVDQCLPRPDVWRACAGLDLCEAVGCGCQLRAGCVNGGVCARAFLRTRSGLEL